MTEIAVRQDTAPAIPLAASGLVEWAHAAQAAHTLATSLVKTSFVPQKYRNKPEEAAVAMLAGAELGLSPLASLRAFDDIQGTAAPKAITLRAVAQSHGHKVDIMEESDVKAVARYRRADEADWKYVEWTIEQARGLGLTGKDNWKKQPKSMLVARVTSEASRRVASDAILGIPYSAEELQDLIPEPTRPVARSTSTRAVRRQEPPAAPEPEFDELDADADRLMRDAVKATAERTDEPITPKQLTALNAALSQDLGFTERDDKLSYLSERLGREITSSKDVTKAEAGRLLDGFAAAMAETEPTLPDGAA